MDCHVFRHTLTGAIFIPYINFHKGAISPQLLRGQVSVKLNDFRLNKMKEDIISEDTFKELASSLPLKSQATKAGDMFLADDGYIYTMVSPTKTINYKQIN